MSGRLKDTSKYILWWGTLGCCSKRRRVVYSGWEVYLQVRFFRLCSIVLQPPIEGISSHCGQVVWYDLFLVSCGKRSIGVSELWITWHWLHQWSSCMEYLVWILILTSSPHGAYTPDNLMNTLKVFSSFSSQDHDFFCAAAVWSECCLLLYSNLSRGL